MKVVLTGASSFTGMWFAEALRAGGHDVLTTFTQPRDSYEDVRRQRVQRAAAGGESVFEAAFGSERFIDALLNEDRVDVLCHHGAETTDYRSPDFDVDAAVRRNTHGLDAVLDAAGRRGCRHLVLTGSVFERGEGRGDGENDELRSFSPYGESKARTAEQVAEACAERDVVFGKYVIPNPFGPYEQKRFTHYLMSNWARGEAAEVRTPQYVRDNVHVSLLALHYARFVQQHVGAEVASKANPSQYAESVGDFAQRVADAVKSRTDWACELTLATQTQFDEPRCRVNTEPIDAERLGWEEASAWDAFVAHYRRRVADQASG